MSRVRLTAGVLALSGVLLTGPADRPAAPGRVAAGLAAPASGASPVLPRFALFGWVSPPADRASAARYAEMAEAGFNTTVLAWQDSGRVADNLDRLAWSRPVGIRNLIFDRTLEGVVPYDTLSWSLIDTVAARYRDDPALLGYYLGDEPPDSTFAYLSIFFERFRRADPAHPAWNNLSGRHAFPSVAAFRAHVDAYVAAVHPSVLCDDHYEFPLRGDLHQMAENVGTLASVAREHGLPFWGIVLLTEHTPYRPVTSGMLRWQVAQWLAWGARGIGYFTYWTPAPDPVHGWRPAMITYDGRRTAMYDTVRTLDARLKPMGEALADCTWLSTCYAGAVPPGGTAFTPDSLLAAIEGRATLGVFADSDGAPVVFVGNADSLAARTVTLHLAAGRRAWRWRDPGGWAIAPVGPGGRLALALDAGDFALVRLSGTADSLAAGRGAPRLAFGPNPARGEVRFAIAHGAGEATLELLDLSGRRVWSHRVAAGETGVAWTGTRDGGGRVTAGVYFARLESAGGVAVRRLAWLGAP